MNQEVAILERDTTDSMKGIAAIIIMVHHISFHIKNMPNFFKLIWYIAFPIVGMFFFFSGYGLYTGMKKEGYWNDFFYKRFYRVLLPYLIVATTWIMIELARGGENYSK